MSELLLIFKGAISSVIASYVLVYMLTLLIDMDTVDAIAVRKHIAALRCLVPVVPDFSKYSNEITQTALPVFCEARTAAKSTRCLDCTAIQLIQALLYPRGLFQCQLGPHVHTVQPSGETSAHHVASLRVRKARRTTRLHSAKNVKNRFWQKNTYL